MISKLARILGTFVLFFIFLSTFVYASQQRVGLALYEVASGENVDYLKKVAKESLSASLQNKGYLVVEIPFTEEEIKKRGVANLLKKDNLDALIAGSIVKVGSNVQVFSRVYTASTLSQPVILTNTATSVDVLLGTLNTHAQLITTELSKTSVPVVAAPAEKIKTTKPVQEVFAPVVTPAPSPAPLPSTAGENQSNQRHRRGEGEAPAALPMEGATRAPVKEEIRETGAPGIPDYKWISNILPFEGRGMAYGDVNGDGQKEIVIVDLKHVYVFEFTKGQVRLLQNYTGGENDTFIRVYTKDLNGDGKEEILVSNINRGHGASFALELVAGEFKELVKNSPWIIKVLNWSGENIIIGEPFNGKLVEYHDLRRLKMEDGKFKDAGKFEAPSEVGIYGVQSFKSQNTEAEQLLYLTPSGYLKIYEIESGNKFKKKWSSSERFGGSANFLRLPQTDMFNEVTNEFTYFNVEPVTWMGSDAYGSIMVPKNDDFLRNMIGTRPVVKNTWFTKLHWQDIGMREVFSTRKIDGYFADNLKVQLPWESQPKLLGLLWVRDKGFLNAMGTFKSVLVIYDL